MSGYHPILAQADGAVGDETRNRLIIFLAYAAVILIVAVWAVFIRKQKSKRRRINRRHPHTWQQSEPVEHRRHRRRREHSSALPQNPSLAEKGGLPPRRPDDVPPAGL